MDITSPRYLDLGQVTRKLELDSLRLFSVVCQEGSYAKAALIEPLTASAISKRIAELERAVGCVLLERSNQGVRPTVAGELMLAKWAEMAVSLSTMLSATEGGNLPQQVRLAMVADDDAARFLVFDCLGHLDALDDATQVAVTRVSLNWLPVEFEKLAMHGAVWCLNPSSMQERDARLASASFDKFRGTRSFRFSAEVCVAVVRDDHPLASLETIATDDLADYEVVCSSGTHSHYAARIARDVPGQSVRLARPSWSYQVGSTLEYLASVPSGAVALVPTSARYLVHRFPGIRCLTLAEGQGCMDFACCLRDDAWLPDRVQMLERLTGCRLRRLDDTAFATSWQSRGGQEDPLAAVRQRESAAGSEECMSTSASAESV